MHHQERAGSHLFHEAARVDFLPFFPPVQPRRPLKFQAYENIKNLITANQISPDHPITEMDLSRLLGIGRTPIREALNLLSKDGIIQLIPHKGAILRSISYSNLIHLYQIRELLDPLAAQQATGRIDPAKLKEIESRYLVKNRTSSDPGYLFSHELHSLIYRSADNPYLVEIFENLSFKIRVCMHSLWNLWRQTGDLKFIKKRNQEHAEIIRALKKGNPVSAGRASRGHIAMAIKDIVRIMASNRCGEFSFFPGKRGPRRKPRGGGARQEEMNGFPALPT